MSGLSGFSGSYLNGLSQDLFFVFIVSFLILFFGLILRRKWLGTTVVVLIVTTFITLSGLPFGITPLEYVAALLSAVLLVLIPARFGVVAMMSFWLLFNSTDDGIPFGTWYATGFAAQALALLAIAVFGFYTSTAGKKLWQGNLLGDGD